MQYPQDQENILRGPSTSLLLSLPEELVEQICRQLSSNRDSSSLAFLCRASKDLNRIATRFLYSGFSSRGSTRRIALFLRTLYERPELCTYVRWLSLDGGVWFNLSEEHIGFISKAAERFGLDVLSPHKLDVYPSSKEESENEEGGDDEGENQARSDDGGEGNDQENVNHTSEEKDKEYDEENDDDDEDEDAYPRSQLDEYPFETMAQLIIASTPNIRSLHVEGRQIMCDTGEGAFTMLEELAKRSPPPASLSHLRHLSFGHEDYREVSFKYFEGIIALAPNIRTILANPCFDQPIYAPKAPINIKNVTDLRFKSGHLSTQGLTTILSSCERLEVFQYYYDTMYSGLDPGCATPRELIDVLSRYKDSLHYLDINLGSREEHQGGLYFGLCIEGQEILSLKVFSRLETLKIDGTSVLFPEVGTDKCHTNILTEMLPQSIRTLHLKDMQKEAAANLVTLTDSLEYFPHLAEIYLAGNEIGGPLGKFEVIFEDSEIQILRERLTSRGISFLKRGHWKYSFVSYGDEETIEYW
ncbi:hypothetical protein TWF569_010303 [Orbilia oligospora]|uniref:F-box domain-containing protein n=1 Tax=Orbilia oligospora TaxID=2813651 RepID=A0A7C8NUH6_ORBOL|nr:hypothetical protein TWF706_009344 [Orbilia oligospora]KAF3113996.1 hypothetical protein TWF706_009344 [Orbilia oligospora]KAF3128845.1 hypothetical protein TWF703_009220 [Orbilia oligospora]KAF3134105.1 hypothetical protein TWF569_010303 [Orbilia oligospora]